MGNITELSQGSLNGLRRQLNECIENAYNKGYADGKKEPREVKAVNVEDTMEYQIGYKVGHEDGAKWAIDENAKDHQGYYNKGYNTALKDFGNLYVYENDYKEFFLNVYAKPFYENVTLFDAVAKYGIEKVMDDFKKWQEQKKQAEEEIKVGDEVITFGGSKAIVTRVEDTNIRLFYSDGSGGRFDNNVEIIEKTGRNFSAEVSQLLDKLKGDN